MNKNLVGVLIVFVSFALIHVAEARSGESEQSNVLVVGASNKSNLTPFPNDERTRKIFEQEGLIEEGGKLVEQGRYDEAIGKYREATKPELLLHDYDTDRPIFRMAKTLKLQGKYEEALGHIEGVLRKYPNVHEGNWLDERLELLALIQSRDTGSPEPLYAHIKYLREKYREQLPPNAGAYSDMVASTIIRLYDHIGDYDRGIEFVEGFFKRCVDGITCKGEERKLAYTPKHPYFQIKQAFEADKSENRPSCVSKSGVCMGRATQALIQSDYFPW